MAQKAWQDPEEAAAKLLPAVQHPRDPLHQSIPNPPGILVPGLVPGPHLADYVLPQNFLPQLLPEKSQGGEDRVNGAAHMVQSWSRGGPAPLSATGAPAQKPRDHSVPEHPLQAPLWDRAFSREARVPALTLP